MINIYEKENGYEVANGWTDLDETKIYTSLWISPQTWRYDIVTASLLCFCVLFVCVVYLCVVFCCCCLCVVVYVYKWDYMSLVNIIIRHLLSLWIVSYYRQLSAYLFSNTYCNLIINNKLFSISMWISRFLPTFVCVIWGK